MGSAIQTGIDQAPDPGGDSEKQLMLAVDLWITGAEPWISAWTARGQRGCPQPDHPLIHSPAARPVTHKLHSLCDYYNPMMMTMIIKIKIKSESQLIKRATTYDRS